jgi:mono/diheme cytochrome c family protein
MAVAAVVAGSWGRAANEAEAQERPAGSPADRKTRIEEGRRLAVHVAMCVQCHTPRNADGALDERRLFQGAPVPVESPYPNQRWAFQAPPIAGLPGGWSEADLVTLLTTGKRPRGPAPSPPMPPFRMTEQQATAVAAYLNSLR